jgi:simple sugar transport system ATP-binding protein
MHDIVKKFPGVIANNCIDFDLRLGEIHALLGENGAGKTTLMKILSGLYRPDSGKIFINGKQINIHSPQDAIELGIGMVHQHFSLINSFTVIENVILGFKNQRWHIDKTKIGRDLVRLSNKYGFNIDPYSKIENLSVGEQQRIEILKILYKGAKILILDEPTAVLTPQEAKNLFEVLEEMKNEGKSIIFISHKLREVMEISDRITILRKGKVVEVVETNNISEDKLAQMMVGKKVLFMLKRSATKPGREILRIENVKAINDNGIFSVRGISFSIHSGEIFGLAGVSGNGQKELAETLTGLRKVKEGKIWLKGKNITNKPPKYYFKNGVNYIPPDRIGRGLVPSLSIIDNSIMRRYESPPISVRGVINHSKASEYTDRLVSAFNIVISSKNLPIKVLSGGNLQKILLAREIAEKPDLLIAVHPTRGLDVGATTFVRKTLLGLRNQGMSILLISDDLDEILMVSDRVGVIYEGQLMGITKTEEADIKKIGLMMGGKK